MVPFKALLVEGTSGVGKSTLIDALIRRHISTAQPRKIRSLVHLAQSHTYGPLALAEDHGTLTVEQNARHLERIVNTLEWLHASVQEHSQMVFRDPRHIAFDALRPPRGREVERRGGIRRTPCRPRMQVALSGSIARHHLGARNRAQNE
jgi:hypothetical protein